MRVVVEVVEGVCAWIIRAGDREEDEIGDQEGGNGGDSEEYRKEAVCEGFGAVCPRIGSTERCSGGEGWDGVDYKTPFLVRLETVKSDIGKRGYQEGFCGVTSCGYDGREGNSNEVC